MKRCTAQRGMGNMEHCAAELSTFIVEYGIMVTATWAVSPGMRLAQMQASPERFAFDVAPRLKAAVGAR